MQLEALFKCQISISFHFSRLSVPLPEFSTFVLQQVIDLFYYGKIMVGAEVKPRIEKALNFLKVDEVVVRKADTQPNSTSNTEGTWINVLIEWAFISVWVK